MRKDSFKEVLSVLEILKFLNILKDLIDVTVVIVAVDEAVFTELSDVCLGGLFQDAVADGNFRIDLLVELPGQ